MVREKVRDDGLFHHSWYFGEIRWQFFVDFVVVVIYVTSWQYMYCSWLGVAKFQCSKYTRIVLIKCHNVGKSDKFCLKVFGSDKKDTFILT